MRKHAEPILKLVCLLLAVLVLVQLVSITRRINPLHNVAVPSLPTLTVKPDDTGDSVPHSGNMNLPSSAGPTKPQPAQSSANTNNPTTTNLVLSATNNIGTSTNIPTKTNNPAAEKIAKAETNAPATSKPSGTNASLIKAATLNGTNSLSPSNSVPAGMGAAANHLSPMNRGGMGMRFNPGGRQINLPPIIQAQVGKIVDSEVFGAMPHPLPMALLGIAGDVAFLRAPDGQSGMVKLGDSLGEIKLVRIGINRVLVEQDGQPKELTIFNGYGSESLLDNHGETNHETHK